jgi:DNA-binding winged helix-turn-helix (wHTH) protein
MLYHQGGEIPLVPKAVETLLVLIERRGNIVRKNELLEAVWPDAIVEESNLFLYLSLLRKTLGKHKDGSPYVETLRRRGYRFNGNVNLVVESKDGPSSNRVNPAKNEWVPRHQVIPAQSDRSQYYLSSRCRPTVATRCLSLGWPTL